MRTRQRRRKSRRTRRGGSALVGPAYTPQNFGSNYYAYNDNPRMGYPANTNVQRGGKWYDMFDPRARVAQPLFSAGDALQYGAKSGYSALAGHYSPVSPDILKNQFQK